MTWERVDTPTGWDWRERQTPREQIGDEVGGHTFHLPQDVKWGSYWADGCDGDVFEVAFRSLAHIIDYGEQHEIAYGVPAGLHRTPEGSRCWRAVYARLSGEYSEDRQRQLVADLTEAVERNPEDGFYLYDKDGIGEHEVWVPFTMRADLTAAKDQLELMTISTGLAAAIQESKRKATALLSVAAITEDRREEIASA